MMYFRAWYRREEINLLRISVFGLGVYATDEADAVEKVHANREALSLTRIQINLT